MSKAEMKKKESITKNSINLITDKITFSLVQSAVANFCAKRNELMGFFVVSFII